MTALLWIGGALALCGAWLGLKIHRAKQEINRLLKTTQQLELEKQQLQAQKAVADTQVQHFETRKKNEQISRSFDRAAVIERLRKEGDLRD